MDIIIPQIVGPEKATLLQDETSGKQVVIAQVRSRAHQQPEGQSHNAILLAMRPNDAERAAIAAGADVYIAQVTYSGGPNEMIVHIGAEAAAAYYGAQTADAEELNERRRAAQGDLLEAMDSMRAAVMAKAESEAAEAPRDQQAMATRRLAVAYTTIQRALAKVRQASLDAGIVPEKA